MKYFILYFLFVFAARDCSEPQQNINLNIYVADVTTKIMLSDAEIGNYGLDDGDNKIFIKEGNTDSMGHLKLILEQKRKKKAQEPFVFHYVVKKSGYVTDTINYNNHGFTSSNRNEVTLDTIYLKRLK